MAEDLASRRRCVERIRAAWPNFLYRRVERLQQQARHGVVPEKVAENIIEDLFTGVLDWEIGDLNNQLDFADIVLSRLGIKYLLLEVKRPGSLALNRRAVDAALEQARRYADEQRVKCIAVTDGHILYAADIHGGGLSDRVFSRLHLLEAPECLWWLSVHGIYRDRLDRNDAILDLTPHHEIDPIVPAPAGGESLLHPKYRIPSYCFAYVPDANSPATWKLPYRLADGSVDQKRLPKAIQCILSNYRGTKVSDIPDSDIAEVLVRLARAAASLGKMPHQTGAAADTYVRLAGALDQHNRLEEFTIGASRVEV